MKNYLKPLLLILVVIITAFLVYSSIQKNSKENNLSNVNWVETTLPYSFKNARAERLSISAFNLKKEGYYDQAIKLYHQAIELEHDNPKLYFDLSECYARNNQLQKAINSINSAIILDSSYPVFYSNRGLYYYQLYDDENAIINFARAVQLDQNSPVYYYNLSIAYYSTNRLDEACKLFKRSKILGLDTNTIKDQKEFGKLQELCK